MQLETVLYEPDGPVLYLTLNRPEKLNAMNAQLRDDLDAALEEADRGDDIRVIVIKGAGRAFCAGYDITPQTSAAARGPRTISADRNGLRHSIDRWLRMWSHRKPIVAQVHGYCLAGGNDLVGACDLIFAAEDAQFGHPAGRALGVLPTLGMWPMKIGMLKSKELFFSGDTVSGKEAERLGMVNRAVPAAELDATVRDYVQRIAQIHVDILTMHKHNVNRWFEIMGLRTAASEGAEFDSIYHAMPAAQEFGRISRERGLKAALEWRDAPFRRS